MKCPKCGVTYSDKVYQVHKTRCEVSNAVQEKEKKEEEVTEEVTQDDKAFELEDLTLEQLHDLCINSDKREHAPSTIKRWKEARCIEELTK